MNCTGDQAFGAGSDISEFPQVRATSLTHALTVGVEVRTGAAAAAAYSAVEDEASAALLEIEHPVLACIHGPCYGGALNLALAADLRYCADDATFCVPPAKLGEMLQTTAMRTIVLTAPAQLFG